MSYLIVKRGKYLEGHSYGTGVGYSFHWTREESKARRFQDDDPSVDGFANQTGGKIVHTPNTRKESTQLYKRSQQ